MRKIAIYFAATVFSILSCTKIEQPQDASDSPEEGNSIVLMVACEKSEYTKTAINPGGSVSWVKGDIIRYYSKSGGTVRSYKIPEDCSSASFTAVLDDDKFLVLSCGGTRVTTAKEDVIKLIGALPQKQDGKFGSTHIGVAKVEPAASSTVNFQNVLGYVRFSLRIDEVARVEFTAAGNCPLHGDGSVTIDLSGDVPIGSYSGKTGSDITINTSGPGTFYMATLPVEMSDGFEMKLFDADSCYIGRVASGNSLKVERSRIVDLGELDSHIEYAPRIGLIRYGSSGNPLTVFKNSLNDAGARLIIFDRYATSTAIAESQVKSVDGIIDPGKSAGDTSSRASCDNRVVKAARKLGRPILGICYGHQRVNTVLGGVTKSVADYYPESTIKHKLSIGGRNVGLHDAAYFHKITIDKTSKLYELLGAEEAMVNTSHDYSVYNISDSLKVVAKSPDGVVEALEGERFLGVQFHPEYLYGELHIAQFLPIFRYLVEMAEDARNNNYYM